MEMQGKTFCVLHTKFPALAFCQENSKKKRNVNEEQEEARRIINRKPTCFQKVFISLCTVNVEMCVCLCLFFGFYTNRKMITQ